MTFLPSDIFTNDIFTIWHIYQWHFYHLAFLPMTFLPSDIFTNDIFTIWHIYQWHFYHLAFLPMTFSKVKVQVFYSLISSLKTYHWTSHFQLPGEHTVLQPFRRIELIAHIVISVLPGTHFHLSQVKHLRVKCLAQGHNILKMSQD